jgi:hypothetical protein
MLLRCFTRARRHCSVFNVRMPLLADAALIHAHTWGVIAQFQLQHAGSVPARACSVPAHARVCMCHDKPLFCCTRAPVRSSFPSFSCLHACRHQRVSTLACASRVLFIALAYAINRLWRLCAREWRHCSVSGVARCSTHSTHVCQSLPCERARVYMMEKLIHTAITYRCVVTCMCTECQCSVSTAARR